jgi:transcriptional regulator with XRE-family HTH domain
MSILMMTPHEMSKHLASRVKARRLTSNLSQQTVSERSGVSYSVLKKFEHTGQISLESLLKLALSLGALEDFYNLFAPAQAEKATSFD